MMVMVAATSAVTLWRAVALLAVVASVSLTTNTGASAQTSAHVAFLGTVGILDTFGDEGNRRHHCWRKMADSTWQQSRLIYRAYVR